MNNLRAFPFFVSESITLDRIGVVVSSNAATAKARIGIYTSTSSTNLYPNALLVDSGELDVATTGLKSATISQALTPGTLYWLACVTGTVAPNLRSLGTAQAIPSLGFDNVFVGPGAGWIVAFTYGALPDPFTAGGSVLSGATLNAHIGVRRVS